MTEEKPQYENNPKEYTEHPELNGLEGVLILVGLGLIIAPLSICYFLYSNYVEIFKAGVWEFLTTPGTEYYIKYFGTLLIAELLINIVLLFVVLYAGYLFLKKKRIFPKLHIGIMLFSLIFVFTDTLVVSAIIPDTESFDNDTIKEITRSLIMACIWVPYMLVSKRVKATFINE